MEQEALARDVLEEGGDGEEGEVYHVRRRRDRGEPLAVAAHGGVPTSLRADDRDALGEQETGSS